jgi:ABC-2 type transport system permease protein
LIEVQNIKKTLRQKYFAECWFLLLFIAIGVLLFCWLRVHVVGELDTTQFKQIIDLLPKNWRKFATVDFDWLVSYLGRTSTTLDEPMLVMLVSGWMIVRGSDVVSGELSRGSMEMLMAQPVSRKSVYWSHAAWTIFGAAILVLIAWLGMSIGIWLTSVEEKTFPELNFFFYQVPMTFLEPISRSIPMSREVNPCYFLPGLVNLFTLAVFIGGFSAWCSSWDRYRWRTLGIVCAFYFSNAGVKILAMASDSLKWIEYLTPFGFYSPTNAIESSQHGVWRLLHLLRYDDAGQIVASGPLLNNLVLLLIGGLLYWWGSRIFHRRDLPAPV